MTSVLDIKMVQVSNGSVLWSYRHEENMRASEATGLVRFPVMARQKYVTKRPWWPWLIVAAGVVVAVAAEAPEIGAGIAVGGGLLALILGKSTKAEGPPLFEPVSATLCRRPHIVDRPPPVPGPVGPVTSDTFREESRTTSKDFAEERRREIKRSVNIFMKQLTKAKGE